MARDFWKLYAAQQAAKKCVCVGLDSDQAKLPDCLGRQPAVEFNRRIVDATCHIAGFYKPNLAFYEQRGGLGWDELLQTIRYIHKVAPEIPVIGDAKRADIGNTNDGYVAGLFDWLEVDAVTVNPYLGGKALAPFLKLHDRGIFALVRTSNEGADEFQNLDVGGKPLYMVVADHFVNIWNPLGNCGLVVGATCPQELTTVRRLFPKIPLLIPGLGAQGGDLEATVRAGCGQDLPHMIINSSRGIIFASRGSDYAEAAGRETDKLHNSIVQILDAA